MGNKKTDKSDCQMSNQNDRVSRMAEAWAEARLSPEEEAQLKEIARTVADSTLWERLDGPTRDILTAVRMMEEYADERLTHFADRMPDTLASTLSDHIHSLSIRDHTFGRPLLRRRKVLRWSAAAAAVILLGVGSWKMTDSLRLRAPEQLATAYNTTHHIDDKNLVIENPEPTLPQPMGAEEGEKTADSITSRKHSPSSPPEPIRHHRDKKSPTETRLEENLTQEATYAESISAEPTLDAKEIEELISPLAEAASVNEEIITLTANILKENLEYAFNSSSVGNRRVKSNLAAINQMIEQIESNLFFASATADQMFASTNAENDDLPDADLDPTPPQPIVPTSF
ncbi:MAG: hypothetical protein HDS82_07030 [Bacteroidales bacterium]|nr:hypothetical protein [Bacteroidales bacterium]